MELKPVDPFAFSDKIFSLLMHRWMLLTAGDFSSGEYNTMTVSWGSFGVLWNRPVAEVVVRPSRFTHEFISRFPTFTLCAFPESHRKALSLLGAVSGRDGNKIAKSGLTPCAAQLVAAPAFAEADFVVECRTLYHHDIDPARFTDPAIDSNYPDRDYHSCYVGEILSLRTA